MNRLDQIAADIRSEEPLDQQVQQAAARVRQNLFAETAAQPARIRSCSDFQALLPSYLNKTLSAARALLLQDHTRECVACRQALQKARDGVAPTLIRPVTVPSRTISKMWAIAAVLVLSVGTGAWILNSGFLTGSNREVAVQSVNGILYAISDKGSTPIFSGRKIAEGERVRTAKESTATVRLGDGSIVEMNERSEISVGHAAGGTTIRLDRGDILVQAAKQRTGTLDVLTPDCLVSVKGTVFAVNRGIKGSRVSVVEGSVKVAQGAQTQMLKPGEQISTDPSLAKVPVQQVIAWSHDSAKYAAVLSELLSIQKRLETMPSAGLRYNSRLLTYVPNNAVLYAAMPNVGSAVGEARRLFTERLQESEALRTWWNEQNDNAKLDDVLQKLQTFSDYLGDEIVFSVGRNSRDTFTPPVLLAEVKRPGLRSFLESQVQQWGGAVRTADSNHAPQIIGFKREENRDRFYTRSRRAAVDENGPMLIALKDNLIAIAWDQDQIDEIASRSEGAPHPIGQNSLLGSAKQVYDTGAGWMLCIDMEQIAVKSVNRNRRDGKIDVPPGLEAMRYLVVERKEIGGKMESQATLNFAGRRAGLAAWLAEPAAMGTLDFVSPAATVAVSMVLRRPVWMMSDLMRYAGSQNRKFQDDLDAMYRESGVRPEDLAAPLGGEFTFALDGPLLPLPSWKLAIEVYDAPRLQWVIDRLIETYNRQNAKPDSNCKDCKLTLTRDESGGRTFYAISSSSISYEIHYVFVDGYVLFAPNRGLLARAIQNRETGYVLSRSEAFRAHLPYNSNLNVSALAYQNLSSAIAPMAQQLGSVQGVSPSQRASIEALATSTAPGLVYAYGEPDRIVVASHGTFFGLNLSSTSLPKVFAGVLQKQPSAARRQ